MRSLKLKGIKHVTLKALLEYPSRSAKEIAKGYNLNYGSVRDAISSLCREGLLKREGKGKYSPNWGFIILNIYSTIDDLQKRVRKLEKKAL